VSDVDLVEVVRVLRDEVLDTAELGDREAAGSETFDAVLAALSVGGESVPGLDLNVHDAVTRRLAWGDNEHDVLADAERVFDRLLAAIERTLRDPADRMVVIEAATQVVANVARVVAFAAVGRASRDRAARLREELAQRQLKQVLEKQRASIVRMELDSKRDF